MKKLLSLLLILTSCGNVTTSQTENISDSAANQDTFDEMTDEEIVAVAYQNFLTMNSTKDIVIADTMFVINKDTIKVKEELKQNGKVISVPKSYYEGSLNKGLQFNVVDLIYTISVNGKAYKNVITRDDVISSSSKDERESDIAQYGNICAPNIGLEGNKIVMNCSLTIPVTDLGFSYESCLYENGAILE